MHARPRLLILPALAVSVLGLAASGCDPVGTLTVTDTLTNPNTKVISGPDVLDTSQHVDPATQGGAIAVRGDTIAVAAPLTDEVVVLDRTSMTVTRRVATADEPHHVVIATDGTIWVTERYAGTVARIPAGAVAPDLRVEVGLEPWGLALNEQGSVVWVSLAGDRMAAMIGTDDGTIHRTVELHGPPRGLALSASRERLAVAMFDGQIRSIDVGDNAWTGPIGSPLRATLPWGAGNPFFSEPFELPVGVLSGARGARAVTAGDASRFMVAHNQITQASRDVIIDAIGTADGPSSIGCEYCEWGAVTSSVTLRPVEPGLTSTDEYGIPDTPAASGGDPTEGTVVDGPLFQAVSDPVDVRRHPTLAAVFVVGQGSDNIGIVDVSTTAGATFIPDPMQSWIGLAEAGQRPTGVAFSDDGAFAYVVNAHSLTVSELDLAPLLATVDSTETRFSLHLTTARATAFGTDPRAESVRRGERLFFFAGDPAVSKNALFACGTCHIDGLDDGITWGFTKGTRQTPSLAGRLHDTAPFNWEGSVEGLSENMVLTIQRMGGEGLDATSLADLEAFLLDGLRAPPTRAAALDPVEQLGEQIFHDPEVGCASCHGGPGLTDGLVWDLGTANSDDAVLHDANTAAGRDVGPAGAFNTPSLIGLRDSAPYLHDGTAASLRAVFSLAPAMGNTSHLTEDELDGLVAYLLTL